MVDWFTQLFWQGWPFLGTDNSARYHTVGIDLSRALPSRVWVRQDNARVAFETVLGPLEANKEWTTVSLWGAVQKIVALMNAAGLLGPELGVDPRWLKATQLLHTAIMVGIVGSHLTHRVLRPVLAPIFFLPAKLIDWHMATLLRPMVQRELDDYHHAKDNNSEKKPPNGTVFASEFSHRDDSTTNGFQQSINEKFLLTAWLLDRSAGMLYFLLAELATRPDLVQELREELAQHTDEDGHLSLSYLAELRKMDSFMLESARMTGSSHSLVVHAAFAYAQQLHAAVLTIKNNGVDHNMRSSRQDSLEVWTHALQDNVVHPPFIPGGYTARNSSSTIAITQSAGWGISDGITFAYEKGRIIALANDVRPDIGGGWALNGSH
ncbi:Fumitremorgin C monooxygenase [Cytospora mali]|uniref:Fumitremorgin C monooxygenase n=1 Tax=Cytospora mali TaxID=578113 RepID=A0A194WDF1_CYTMA|nr:Fumitremorgin C monooxygenase [Valsa mali]